MHPLTLAKRVANVGDIENLEADDLRSLLTTLRKDAEGVLAEAANPTNPWAHPVPDLGVGTRLEPFFARQKASPEKYREMQAVAFILDYLASKGFKPNGGEVLDGLGGEESGTAHDTASAMEAIFNLDDSRVYMADANGKDVGHLFFVLGNSPEEVLADWSWKKADGEGPGTFNHAVDEATKLLWGNN